MTVASRQPFPTQYLDRLLNADCIRWMSTLLAGSVDFILTDPPYLARFVDRDGRRLRNDDNDDWLKPAFAEAFRILRPGRFLVSWYGWPKAQKFFEAWRAAGFRPVGHFVAVKSYTSSKRFVQYRHEAAYLLAKGDVRIPRQPIPDVLPWKYTGNRLHPTQKPVCTLVPLIRAFSKPGEVVVDPFAGSASTLVAAYQAGRHYAGTELDEQYFALAQERLARLRRRVGAAAA